MSELPPAPERLAPTPPFTALHGRLLLTGDALNPQKRDLSPVTKDTLGSLDNRDYSRMNSRSVEERSAYWQGKEGNDFDKQRAVWKKDTLAAIQAGKEYFTQNGWNEAFQKMLKTDISKIEDVDLDGFYKKYFQGEKAETNMKVFVKNILEEYVTESNGKKSVDMATLQKHLPAIQWFSGVFGTMSSEVVQHIVEAEAKLIESPDALVEQINQEQTVSGTKSIRLNHVNPQEERILKFLWDGTASTRPEDKPTIIPTSVSPQPARPNTEKDYKLSHQRLVDPNTDKTKLLKRDIVDYPGREESDDFDDPRFLAKQLRKRLPQKYGAQPENSIVEMIQKEQRDLRDALKEIGINYEDVQKLVNDNINSYQDFLTSTYKVTIPLHGNIKIMPLYNLQAEALGAPNDAFAYVDTQHPIIYADFRTILNSAGVNTLDDLKSMDKNTVHNAVMKKLVDELNPHEYTHLINANTYLRLEDPKQADPKKKEVGTIGARTGLRLSKAAGAFKDGNDTYVLHKSRGRGLNEGVNAALNSEWAKSVGKTITESYTTERQVLDTLISVVAQEDGIDPGEIKKLFVDAQFNHHSLRTLIERIDGKDGVTDTDGKKHRKRPHLYQIVNALMNEVDRQTPPRSNPDYSLVLSYINAHPHEYKLVSLPDEERRAILTMVAKAKRELAAEKKSVNSLEPQLSAPAIQVLEEQLGATSLPHAA